MRGRVFFQVNFSAKEEGVISYLEEGTLWSRQLKLQKKLEVRHGITLAGVGETGDNVACLAHRARKTVAVGSKRKRGCRKQQVFYRGQ